MVFDTIDYGIIILDKEHLVTLANPIALKVLQMMDAQPMGKKIEELAADYSKEMYEIIQWTYEHQEKFEQKPVRSMINGETHYYDIHTYPQFDTDGEIQGVIFVYKNITEERLIRRQLIEADKLSRLGQIAAGKVHEIKNPLTTVRGYLQFLKQKVVSGDEINLHSFDIALQEIDRTNELINSLLILSKQSKQKNERIRLNSLFEEVTQLFQHQLLMKNITLVQNIDADLWVNGVENHLKQIIINLFLNAIDAVSDKKGDGQIALQAKEKGHKISIQLQDNGIGISQEDIAKLSIPFFTTKENGTGLGLSVTYKLIEEHAGTIQVFSEIGQGTTFTIQLPSASKGSNLKQKEVVFS
ncbi:ATP-binding protein [Tepidibacillus marianensis]|uniref:two-component system sensor histidine kinase NtrB n=1 Tax=Tepidibacillus marianensis TaxID=3131995 RepID=UPI0030CB95DC